MDILLPTSNAPSITVLYPVLIDTDAGVDDALALIAAFRSPEVSVKAVTTVAGNVEVWKCFRNVHTVMDMVGLQHRPQVALGASKPLSRPLVTAPEVHGKDGLGNTQRGRLKLKAHVRQTAVDVIVDCCKWYGNTLTIVALGPLTNIARAWKRNPVALASIRRLVSMGGAFQVEGNTGPVAEFNYYVDPEAAKIVLESRIPVTVVPLDLTEQVPLMRNELKRRIREHSTTLARFIAQCTGPYMSYHKKTEGLDGCYLHDPIAVATALHPVMVKTRRLRVEVETEGDYARGMTVAEHGPEDTRMVDVAVTLKKRWFIDWFHSRLWL